MGDYDFQTDFLNANLSGGSSISLTVNQELSIEASGGSSVLYKGDGIIINEDLSDGSSIQHVN